MKKFFFNTFILKASNILYLKFEWVVKQEKILHFIIFMIL